MDDPVIIEIAILGLGSSNSIIISSKVWLHVFEPEIIIGVVCVASSE